jgi:hypothetical protein
MAEDQGHTSNDEIMNAVSSLQGTMGLFDQVKQQTEGMEFQTKRTPDGEIEHKVTMSDAALNTLMQALNKLHTVEAGQQQAIARIQQQESMLRQNPILNVLTQVAGQLGSQQNMPGWSQALGKASLALNPTAQQLQGREMEAQQGLAGTIKEEAGIATQMAGLGREERLAGDAMRREQLGYYERGVTAAMQGEFVGDAFEKMQISSGADPAVAHARRQELEGIADQAARARMDKAKATTALENQKAEDRLKEIKLQGENALKVAGLRNEASEKAVAAKAAKSESGEELKAYTTKVKDKLEAAGELEDEVKKLRVMLQQRDSLIGQFKGRMVPTWAAKQRADVEFKAFTQMNAIRGMIGAGARFWNPTEYSNLSPKLVQINKPTDVNLAIADETEKFIQNNRKWTVMTNPDVNWDSPKRQAALGADGPGIVKGWHAAMTDVTEGTVPPSQADIPKEVKDIAAKGPQDGQPRYIRGKGKRYTVVNGVVTGVEDAK